MCSFSLFLDYHLPEVSISGLGFSAKVKSKQTIKIPVVTEHKGQKVKCVGSIHSHFPYFSFFSSMSHFFKDSLIFYTDFNKPFCCAESPSVLPSRKIGCAYRSAVSVLRTKTYMTPKNLNICSLIQALGKIPQAHSSRFQIFENSLPAI